MKAPKCANCGAQMIETYTKQGLRLYVCPHITIKQVNKITGKFLFGEIHCNATIQGLKASFEKLMSQQQSTTTIEQLRKATANTVSDAELYEGANLGVMLGIPADELTELFNAAYRLGLSLGQTPKYAISSLCRGIGRRSRLILDNIGVAFKAQDAYRWYAETNNKSKLTEAEKVTAWQQFAIQQIKDKVQML